MRRKNGKGKEGRGRRGKRKGKEKRKERKKEEERKGKRKGGKGREEEGRGRDPRFNNYQSDNQVKIQQTKKVIWLSINCTYVLRWQSEKLSDYPKLLSGLIIINQFHDINFYILIVLMQEVKYKP